MYTIDDLSNAKAECDEIAERWSAAYSTNRPNPLDMQAKAATKKVQEIEEDLKRRGVLPYTDRELIEESLDAAFPNAQSREIVQYNGERYQKRLYPLERSKSGKTVRKWRTEWEWLDE